MCKRSPCLCLWGCKKLASKVWPRTLRTAGKHQAGPSSLLAGSTKAGQRKISKGRRWGKASALLEMIKSTQLGFRFSCDLGSLAGTQPAPHEASYSNTGELSEALWGRRSRPPTLWRAAGLFLKAGDKRRGCRLRPLEHKENWGCATGAK